MPTDVNGNFDDYWVELKPTEEGDRRSWQDRGSGWKKKKLPELTLMVHHWKDLAAGENRTATLTLFDIDSTEGRAGGPGKDEPFAKLKLTLSRVDAGIAAKLEDAAVDAALKPFYLRKDEYVGDFKLRVGKKVVTYKLSRADMHTERFDGALELGFELDEGDRRYTARPPKLGATFVTVSDAVEDMLALPDRFSDPARKPSLKTEDAAKGHAKATLDLLKAEAGKARADLDLDGIRIESLLDGTVSRRALIETMMTSGGPAMTGKTRELFAGQKDALLGSDPVLDSQWSSSDCVKAYFMVHDYGILTNNRKALHYQAKSQNIRWKPKKDAVATFGEGKVPQDKKYWHTTAVHGFLNWSGAYAPAWEFDWPRYGTKASFKKPNPKWGPFTVEIEHAFVPFYRPAPKGDDAMVKFFAAPPADASLPTKLLKGADKSGADQDYDLACLTWKYPMGWGDRKKVAPKECQPKAGKDEVAVLVAGAPKVMIDGMVDLYLLASLRAGHLLTVTTHVEADRVLNGHSDPSGIDLDVFYDAITDRISKTGKNKLAGLGGLTIPKGTRYGMHPRRLTGEPVVWNGIPVSRILNGTKAKWPTKFPQQSSLPTGV